MAKNKTIEELEELSPQEVAEMLLKESRSNNCNIEYCKDLIAHGADLEARYKDMTPLHWAVIERNIELVKLLIQAGADIESRDKSEFTPLLLATVGIHNKSMDIVIFKLLLAAGANLEARSNNGCTTLHYAAWNDKAEVVRYLLNIGYPKDVLDEHNATPWNYAKPTIKAEFPQLNPKYNE